MESQKRPEHTPEAKQARFKDHSKEAERERVQTENPGHNTAHKRKDEVDRDTLEEDKQDF